MNENENELEAVLVQGDYVREIERANANVESESSEEESMEEVPLEGTVGLHGSEF